MAESIKKDEKDRTMGGKAAPVTEEGVPKFTETKDDWAEFDISFVSVNSTFPNADILEFTSDIDVDEYFQIGDKIKIGQVSGNIDGFKYFYLMDIDSDNNRIYLYNIAFVLTNDDITYFGMSRLESPKGLPTAARYSGLGVYNVSGGASISVESSSIVLYFNGRVIHFSIYIGADSFPAGVTAYYIKTDLRLMLNDISSHATIMQGTGFEEYIDEDTRLQLVDTGAWKGYIKVSGTNTAWASGSHQMVGQFFSLL